MGVKSLWDLLTPVGRPVLLETMEGKAMAIDSSIWIYQFQATMRDKEGRALVNAHVLGFLRRICKLLFYGIKPVFVFDGGAPALKRNTIAERKKKKSGAAASHAKVAERLLAAHMRREAINHTVAQKAAKLSKGKEKAHTGPVEIDENTVYLEDLDNTVPKTPTPSAKGKEKAPGPSPFSASKNRWHDHDPYKLPEVDVQERVAKASKSAADPRLATEEELRSFIEDMRPEDFDVTSPAFRELPTEVQYEIVGDLRLKSRQTSYQRLQNMLRHSSTPLDFSKEQIKNLQQRNSLTQQLLMTTDTIGQAHIAIPVRIASERNREYVLMKNTEAEGGWVLGIRDHGTRTNPIQIDQEQQETKDEDDDEGIEMEEVQIPEPLVVDADLQEYQREMALAGIGKRRTSKNLLRLSTKPPKKKPKPLPLFEPDDDEPSRPLGADDDDAELMIALQESIDLEEEATFRRAVEASRLAQAEQPSTEATSTADSIEVQGQPADETSDVDDLYVPNRLETALAIANAGPTPKSFSSNHFSLPRKTFASFAETSPFGQPILLPRTQTSPSVPRYTNRFPAVETSSPFGRPTLLPRAETSPATSTAALNIPHRDMEDNKKQDSREVQSSPKASVVLTPKAGHSSAPSASTVQTLPTSTPVVLPESLSDSDDDLNMEEVLPTANSPLPDLPSTRQSHAIVLPASTSRSMLTDDSAPLAPSPQINTLTSTIDNRDSEDEPFSDWSRSPSPVAGALPSADQGDSSRTHKADETWDAAQEMDPLAEEGEFVRFMSQVKGKDLDAVRREIDEEIRTLHQQKKVAMRDSEDITQQMISQIMVMLRLFGIPYITAPMEAEAQCATLVQLGLVEGIITDDSDVFLFGGLRVFKNMFNQSKTVECFLLSDLGRELGLERDKLIQLAYLLGSDYIDGVPGVGPVVAMELLKEFPGSDGLHKFKDWWQRVQSGRDRPEDTNSKFKQRFKKKFKDLYLADDWPNAAVRDAYYHPTVDESDEPFKWGLPDLDGLRNLFQQDLGWSSSKVEELLLPIIQKMGRRGQAQALNKQGNLNDYFDVAAGQGAYAPRKQKAYASKRLQQVVNDFRNEQTKLKDGSASAGPSLDSSSSDDDTQDAPVASAETAKKGTGKATTKAPREKSASTKGKAKGTRGTMRERVRGRGGASGSRKRKRPASSESEDEASKGEAGADDGSDPEDTTLSRADAKTPPPLAVKLRPRARPAYKGKIARDERMDSGGHAGKDENRSSRV